MILLIHRQGKAVVEVISDEEVLELQAAECTTALWELASRYPEKLIGWCDENHLPDLDLQQWQEVFHHDLIMASYAVEHIYLPDSIGYVDQMPFVNVPRDVLYGTWKMSRDVGGIKGKVLLRFRELMGDLRDLDQLLNSVAKLGQQNGLFCYSAPQLILKKPEAELQHTASTTQLISFVYQHYKSIRLAILFWCFVKYEKRFPLFPLLQSLPCQKYFRKKVDLGELKAASFRQSVSAVSVDVIIPTMGRKKYLYDVLKDLAAQTLLPEKVIVVEQNPRENAGTELPYLRNREWPFEVVHHFLHHPGVCHARNLALREVTANWVFFADDDIRIPSHFLQAGLEELQRLRADCLNFNCRQEGEETIFKNIKQWGSFGSGTSMVRSTYAKRTSFSEILEYGYGEDQDYGMQLRKLGCDIIYHPDIKMLHLKAPAGGFRNKVEKPWEKEDLLPKPSPTLIVFAKRNYTNEQIIGFRTELFLRYYSEQDTINPLKYTSMMREKWKKSEEWAEKLIEEKASKKTSLRYQSR